MVTLFVKIAFTIAFIVSPPMLPSIPSPLRNARILTQVPPAYRKNKDFPVIWDKADEYNYCNMLEAHFSRGPNRKIKVRDNDWLKNVVSELESQIDSFEAELEGLSVKKGKTIPPKLVLRHL